MNEKLLASLFERFAYVMSCYARVEGMKADNTYREMRGESIAYGSEQFMDEASNIDTAARYFRDFG